MIQETEVLLFNEKISSAHEDYVICETAKKDLENARLSISYALSILIVHSKSLGELEEHIKSLEENQRTIEEQLKTRDETVLLIFTFLPMQADPFA